MVFILDGDDPLHDQYPKRLLKTTAEPSGRRGMTDPVNQAIARYWDNWDVIGFVGDDHRFRTNGWDAVFTRQLNRVGGGMAYANDGNWVGGEIPTQIFASSIIWKTLGWMALPTAQHLYLDNAWRIIGDGVGRLFYFPDILIEHMHPAYGKTDWDEGYRAVNSSQMYEHDRAAFETWLQTDADADIERVRKALHG
jgi:hypothetical protein